MTPRGREQEYRPSIGLDIERRWRPPAQVVIAILLLVEALIAATFAIWPPAAPNQLPDAVLAVLLALASLGCALTWRRRITLGLLEAFLVIAWGVPLVLIATRMLESSQLLWAAIVVLASVVVAFYLPTRSAALHIAAIVVGYAFVALAVGVPTRPMFVGGVVLCIVSGAVAVGAMRRDRDRILDSVASIAITDPLTGLLNRRGLQTEAAVVHANAERAGVPTVVALLDIDGLKAVNDEQGHEAGDALLRSVAAHARAGLRAGDLIARVGGDEFVVVLPQADEQSAGELMERIRQCSPAPWSQGCAMWREDRSLDEAIHEADGRMYEEKRGRRGAIRARRDAQRALDRESR